MGLCRHRPLCFIWFVLLFNNIQSFILHFRGFYGTFHKGFVDITHLGMDRYFHKVDYIPSDCGMLCWQAEKVSHTQILLDTGLHWCWPNPLLE